MLVIPQEALEEHAEFHPGTVFRDRHLVPVDENHPEVGEQITLEQFSTPPHLATSSGHARALAGMRLDFLEVPRNTEITAGSGFAPLFCSGELASSPWSTNAWRCTSVRQQAFACSSHRSPAFSRSPRSWPRPPAPTRTPATRGATSSTSSQANTQ